MCPPPRVPDREGKHVRFSWRWALANRSPVACFRCRAGMFLRDGGECAVGIRSGIHRIVRRPGAPPCPARPSPNAKSPYAARRPPLLTRRRSCPRGADVGRQWQGDTVQVYPLAPSCSAIQANLIKEEHTLATPALAAGGRSEIRGAQRADSGGRRRLRRGRGSHPTIKAGGQGAAGVAQVAPKNTAAFTILLLSPR